MESKFVSYLIQQNNAIHEYPSNIQCNASFTYFLLSHICFFFIVYKNDLDL